MPDEKGGILIVQFSRDPKKIGDVKARLSKLDCVRDVEVNYISGKLKVTNDGTEKCVVEIRRAVGAPVAPSVPSRARKA